MNNRGIPVHSTGSGDVLDGHRIRHRKYHRFTTGHLVWGGLLRIIQRLTRYKHGDKLEFKLNFAVPDLVSDKGRAVKDQLEALVQAVQKAGSYQAKEEAARALHAVMDALKDRVPPDALSKLGESLPVREMARLRQAATQRLQRGGDGADQADATALDVAMAVEATAGVDIAPGAEVAAGLLDSAATGAAEAGEETQTETAPLPFDPS